MPEYFWICRMLSELGFAVEYVFICLRAGLSLHLEYIFVVGMYSCRLEHRLQSTCVLAAQDEAHIVFVLKLEGEGSSRPAPRRPCRVHVVFVPKLEGEGSSGPAPCRPCGSEGFSYLGECWTTAKPPSERGTHHSVGFQTLRRVLDCS